ncbi:MAG: hypothetical protein ABI143_08420 [Caldimonas sp.]
MPIWQEVEDACERLTAVRVMLDEAFRDVIESRNAGGLPGLEILVAEVERLTRSVMDALRVGGQLRTTTTQST